MMFHNLLTPSNIKLMTKTMSGLFSVICSCQKQVKDLCREVFPILSATEQSNRITNNSLRQCPTRNVYWCSNHINNQLAVLVSELEDKHNQKAWPSFSVLELNSLASPVTMREQRCGHLPVSNCKWRKHKPQKRTGRNTT